MRQLQVSDFTPDFNKNVEILEEVMGAQCHELPRAVFEIEPIEGGTITTMATTRGKFKTAALLRYFMSITESMRPEWDALVLKDDMVGLARAFFGELMETPVGEHPMIDLLARQPRGRSLLLRWKADGTGLAERLANRGRDQGARVQDVMRLMTLLEHGAERAAEPNEAGEWVTQSYVKDGILQFFGLAEMGLMDVGCGGFDKVPILWAGWSEKEWARRGFRAVPPATVRIGACIERGVILMPSYVNTGAFVGSGSMIDTWATVGSCAQVGKDVHLSGGAGIGGVLEPIQASPTIIEDGVFIGARSEVAEGVIVYKRAVLSMGVFIGRNTPIVDRPNDNRILKGAVPENAVVMMGVHPTNGLCCPQIVKYRDEKTSASVALEDALR